MGEGEEEEEEELWEEEGKGGKFGRKMWEGEEEEEKEDEENDEDKAERERSKKREVERMLMEEEEKEEKEEEEKEEEEEEEKEKEWDKRLLRLTSLRGQLQQDVEEQLEKRGAVGSTGSKKVGFTGPPPTQVDSSDSDEGSDNSGSGSEYEDALPLDTFVLCGQMGTTECKRDVYDVAVHPAVIEACNADKEGQALRQLNQQLLLAVTHVQSELRFPGFEANPITGNYLPRMQVRSAEQKDKDRRHYEQQQEQWTSSLSYWDYLTGTDRGPQPHSSLHKRDRRQPRLSVPAPAAFLHLHCAASSDEDLLNAPPGFDQWAVGSVGSTEFPCYEAALPNLALLRPGQELQARTMVHKLQVQARSRASQPQAPGRDSTSFRLSRNSFGASSFHLPSMQRKRSTLLGGAVYSSDDGNSDDGSETDLASIKILSVKPKHETQYSSLGKKAVYDTRSCRVQGTAAFVIKARSGGKKVFVNVLHNSCFDALAQAGVVCLDQDEEPLTGVGESRSEMGSDGSPCLLFTVLLASSLCRPAKDRRRFERDVQQDWAVHRILETLNEVCGESMGMDYSLPRTRSLYKGRQDPQRPMDFSFKTAQRERPILAPQRSSTGAQLREAQVQSKGKGGLATIDEAEEGEGVLDAGAEGQEDEEVDSGTKRGEGGERAAMERSLTLRELEEEEEEEASAGSSGPPVQSVARPTLTKTKSRQQAQLRIGGRGDTRQGASMVTIDMVLYCLELSLGQEEVQRLKFEAIKSPNALLGWQCVVVLEAGAEAGLYVITKVSKASVRQQLMGKHTLFRISHPDRGDQWVQLKRKPSQKKQALYFHPTRKVLFLEHKQK
ncbi:hypothetical protein B484DRAFT_454016 [Ochromonadaceae sp. CCMP2298]|nr:hypothetical protein B484DRAFT_454016 [Ochromonadaceae sp. CCMP2298]